MPEQPENPNERSVGDDVLRGAIPIGVETDLSPQQVYYQYKKRKQALREGDAQKLAQTYPIAKMGKMLIASQRALRRTHQRLTASTKI